MAGRGRFWCGAVSKNSPSTPTISVTLPPGKIRWRRLSEWPDNAGKSSNALRLPRANAGWITTRFATGKVGTGTSRWPCWPMQCYPCCERVEKKTPDAQVRLSVPEPVSYTHLRAHETDSYLVCRLLLEKKKNTTQTYMQYI